MAAPVTPVDRNGLSFEEGRPLAVIQPLDLMTDGGDGPNRRLRVDVAQTSFFAGKEFRTFKRLSLGAGASYIIRAVVGVNTILAGLAVNLVDGWIDIETVVGGTPGGVFAEVLPIFNRNNMTGTPAHATQNVLTAGGTHTGGTILDVLAARASGATAQASSVGASLSDERGILPGTYYFRVTNPGAGAAAGVFSARWEERS